MHAGRRTGASGVHAADVRRGDVVCREENLRRRPSLRGEESDALNRLQPEATCGDPLAVSPRQTNLNSAVSTTATTDALPLVLAITGESGAAYAVRLLEVLVAAGRTVYLSISPAGKAVLHEEWKSKSISTLSIRRHAAAGLFGPSLTRRVPLLARPAVSATERPGAPLLDKPAAAHSIIATIKICWRRSPAARF